MPFDTKTTLELIKGGLFNAEETWKAYLEQNPPWQQTAMTLTGPLLVANVLLSLIFSRLVGGYNAFGHQSGWFTSLALGLLLGAFTVTITAIVFNFMAGIFKGRPDFSRAFAAISLAVIPGWVASAVAAIIPYLGVMLALAGGILSLVYMYRLMPMALHVPQEKRVIHFVLALAVIIICNMVMGAVLGMTGAFGGSDYAV